MDNVFHVSLLKKYIPDDNHVIDWNVIRVEKEGTIQEHVLLLFYFALLASMFVHDVFHVSFLKKYISDANHVIDWNVIRVEKESAFQVYMVRILYQKRKQLWNRSIRLVKVQWTYYGPEDTTWDHEDAMWSEYPHLFEDFENLVDVV